MSDVNRPSNGEVRSFRGHEVVDDKGNKIGKVTDVLYDDVTMSPRWMIVNVGLFSAAHYVPAAQAYEADDGHVVVPFDKQLVKQAPRAHRDHVLTRDLEEQLRAHYHLAA